MLHHLAQKLPCIKPKFALSAKHEYSTTITNLTDPPAGKAEPRYELREHPQGLTIIVAEFCFEGSNVRAYYTLSTEIVQ